MGSIEVAVGGNGVVDASEWRVGLVVGDARLLRSWTESPEIDVVTVLLEGRNGQEAVGKGFGGDEEVGSVGRCVAIAHYEYVEFLYGVARVVYFARFYGCIGGYIWYGLWADGVGKEELVVRLIKYFKRGHVFWKWHGECFAHVIALFAVDGGGLPFVKKRTKAVGVEGGLCGNVNELVEILAV